VEVSLTGFNLDIIIPVYNEGEHLLPWLQEIAGYLQPADRIVVVDASDQLIVKDIVSGFIVNNGQIHYVKSNKGRALQMNAGVKWLANLSTSKLAQDNSCLLWFLHCDSGLSQQHIAYLRSLDTGIIWGRFDVQLMPKRFPFAIISRLINFRSRITQVMTGDQGIFIRSDVFKQLQGYANIPLMEDVEISKRLRVLAKADCDGPVLYTSARRWQKHGWVKTVLLMWQLRLMYWRGVSPEVLVKKYYG
jgi:rSAM/selenodomain-associated transferase 2